MAAIHVCEVAELEQFMSLLETELTSTAMCEGDNRS